MNARTVNALADARIVSSPRKIAAPIPELAAALLRVMEWLAIISIGLALRIDYHEVAIAVIFYASLTELTGAYDSDIRFSVRRAWARMASAGAATSLFMVSLNLLLNPTIRPAPLPTFMWFVSSLVTLMLARTLATLTLRHFKRAGQFNQRVAIYGVTPQGIELSKYIIKSSSLTIDFVGFYDERLQSITNLPTLKCGSLDDLVAAIRKNTIDQVIIALPWSEDIYLRSIVSRLTLTPVRIRLTPDLALLAYPNRPLVMLGALPLMTLFERPISGLDQLIKRIEDLILAAVLTIMTAPLLLLTALAIKLDSDGPVFFRQPREGFNNQHFRIWKFRSMHTNTCQETAITQATQQDPRITRVGRFIRRTSIDELPQLFNVLGGDMSLVGPRPHAPSTRAGTRLFPDVIHTYAARHKVKPGITGWAQACGWRGETDTEEKLIQRVEHDLYYIERWSVAFDLYILLRTVFALAGAKVY